MARQQLKQHASTFTGGMNKDSDYTVMKPNMYLHAENLRLVADEYNSTGALENVKGNKFILYNDTIRGNSVEVGYYYDLIGYAVNGNKVILFMAADGSDHSTIYEVVFDGNTISSQGELYSDYDAIYSYGGANGFGWDSNTNISAILRKENVNIENLYWLDGIAGIRSFNILDAPDGSEVKDDDGYFVPPENFSSSPSFPFKTSSIELSSIGNGSLKAGMVQYAYRFTSSSGSQSPISVPTGLFHISKSDEFASDTKTYQGSDISTDCGKSFTLKVTVDSSITGLYDIIEPYSIHYDSFGGLPVINRLNDVNIGGGATEYQFTDSGSRYIETITLAEFLIESSSTTSAASIIGKARLLETKDNRLFLADVETAGTGDIDLSNYDARAYRFHDGSPPISNIYNSSGSVEATIDGTSPSWPADKDLDAINPYNYGPAYGTSAGIVNPMGDYAWYKYKADGATLGAEGPNIEVDFEYKTIILDDSSDLKEVSVTAKDGSYGFDNYASPYNTANNQSYQRDEIYRFAIKFLDNKGHETSPQWICDLRIPHILESTTYEYVTGVLKGYVISPKFTINNMPPGATSYQILRTERTSNDMSVISQGTLRPTLENARDTDNRDSASGWQTCVHPETSIPDFNGAGNLEIEQYLLEFYSPEISFYKEAGFPLNGDYMESIGYMNYEFGGNYLASSILEEGEALIDVNSYMLKFYGPLTNDMSIDTFGDAQKILRSEETIMSDDLNDQTFNSYTIGPYKYWTYMISKEFDDDRVARSTSSMVYHTDYGNGEHITDTYEPFNGGTGGVLSGKEFKNPMLANYKRNNYDTMYGGNIYAARQNNRYIPITSVIKADSTPSSTTPFKGDIFISAFDLQPITYEPALVTGVLDHGYSLAEVDIIPVETRINTELRMGDYSTKYSEISQNIKYFNEDGFESQNIEPLYMYNTVYSSSNNTKTEAVITDEQAERTTNVFNNRIVASNKKIDGEADDSWIKYPANNYIDIDSSYGTITKLVRHEDKLYFFQERGVGIVSVNERSLVQDESGQQLALGTGTLLSRFDYITTDFGCSDKKSIVDSGTGLYWFDSYNNTIVHMYRDQYGNQKVASLTKEKYMQPFMNEYDFISCVAGKDDKHNEILFTLSNSSGDIKTLVYNERLGLFQSFYSVDAVDYINVNRELVSTDDSRNFAIHGRDDCDYGEFYQTVNNSTIKLLVNSDIGITKVFDVINYINHSEDSSGKFIFYDTLDKIRVYDTYQNSDWVDLVYDDTVTKRGKDWSLRIPRNAVTIDLDSNPDVFDAGNLDTTKRFKERMRDKYLIVEVEYDNSLGYRFNIPLFVTKYRISYR